MNNLWCNRIIKSFTSSLAILGIMGATLPSVVASVEAATTPGYNGKLLLEYSNGGAIDIYQVSAGDSELTNFTNSVGADYDAAWSPDGSQVALSASRDGNQEIYVVEADGSNPVRVTTNEYPDGYPAWSPDGSKIAFNSLRGGNWDIYVVDADGSNEVRLTTDAGMDRRPEWSKNGNTLYFESNRNGVFELWSVDTEGGNLNRYAGTSNVFNASLSPDGDVFVYATNNYSGLFTYTLSTEVAEQLELPSDLPADAGHLEQATWSPDGNHLLLTYWDDTWDNTNQFLYEISTQQLTELTHVNEGNDWVGYGAWQPILNQAPTITEDTLTTPFNTAGTLDVIINDTDEEALEGQNLTIVTQPFNGTASVVDGKVKYTPSDGFSGSDQLTYQICDSFLLDQKCATGVLVITVQAPGSPALSVSKIADTVYQDGSGTYSTSNKRPIFSGTASPGATVKVEIHSDPILLTTTANGAGEWSVAPSADLPVGEHTVYISATLNGVTTELDSFVLGITDEALIPSTGASTVPLRASGLAILGLGVSLSLVARRQRASCCQSVPSLYP